MVNNGLFDEIRRMRIGEFFFQRCVMLKKYLAILFVFLLVLVSGCEKNNPNYSGLYNVIFGPNPVFTMDIDHVLDGTYATFVLKG